MNTARTRRHPLFYQITRDLERGGLVPASGRLLVAVSGGPDSVCLLAVLDELRRSQRCPGLVLHVAHMNYGLRGRESDDDEAFVQQLAGDLGIPVSCERAELPRARGESLQAKARQLRYEFFDRVCQRHQLSAIATGHTAEDQAETVLMWLLRGSGTKGLAGIPILREDRILRPLLHARRADILEYLALHHLPYREDRSNSARVYQRNRVRHDLLPHLRIFNPQIVNTLAQTAEILSQDAALLEGLERERWPTVVRESGPDRVALDVEALRSCSLGLQRRLIRRAWTLLNDQGRGLGFRHLRDIVDTLLSPHASGCVHVPANGRVRRQGPLLIVESARAPGDRPAWWASGVPLAVPGEVVLDQHRRIAASLVSENGGSPQTHVAERATCMIDLDRAGTPLIVRAWQPGDWFCPIGMSGRRKKLQDFFVDHKILREQRAQVPLVTGPTGILWVVGYRGDERVRPQRGSVRVAALWLKEGAAS